MGIRRLPIFVVLSDSPSQQARMLCFRGFMFVPALHPNGARPAQHRCLEALRPIHAFDWVWQLGHAAVWINVVCVGCEVLEDTVDCLHQKRAGPEALLQRGIVVEEAAVLVANFFDQLRCTPPPAINGLLGIANQ